jgi:hypothetical protein
MGRSYGSGSVTSTTGAAVPRRSNIRVRPLGGAPGCLAMVLISVVGSILLTVMVNLIVR